MAFPDVLSNFQRFSRSYYITSTAVTILFNVLVLVVLAGQKFPRNGVKCNCVMLFSLSICDILYEAATTSLFLQFDFCEVAEKCKVLYFIYLVLNLCTVFHIMVEIVQKTMSDVGRDFHGTFASRVYWSIFSWLMAFVLAYIDLKSEIGLMDGIAMAFLGQFKAFGYLVFAVICFSGVLVFLLTVAFAKPHSKNHLVAKFQPLETTRREITFATSSEDDLLFSCIFMAIFVAWCAWVVLGVDSRIMKTIEVMKSFEVIRLTARIMNPLTILYLFTQKNKQFIQRKFHNRCI